VAVVIGMLVGGLFEYNLGDSEVLMMFVSVLALGMAAAQRVNTSVARKPLSEGGPVSPALAGNVAV
jgi:LytS/YehU family sensor histidine kinase